MFLPLPRPATTGCHHVVGFDRKRAQCMVGVIRMGTKLSFPGHPLPAFRRGGQAREPSSQLQPIWKGSVSKSKEPEKIIHTKNKLCHESFDFAFPPEHIVYVLGELRRKEHLICFRLAKPLFKELHIQCVPIGPRGLNQGLWWWGLTVCYFCCHWIGVQLCMSFSKMKIIALVRDPKVLGSWTSPGGSYSEGICGHMFGCVSTLENERERTRERRLTHELLFIPISRGESLGSGWECLSVLSEQPLTQSGRQVLCPCGQLALLSITEKW